MNKAFTKETDPPEDEDEEDFAVPALPVGSKNYMTPYGYARLSAELDELWKVERPKLVETIFRLRAMAIVQKMATISMAKSACVKLTAVYVF